MDGDRVIPRFKTDVSDAPLVLPVTGDERAIGHGMRAM